MQLFSDKIPNFHLPNVIENQNKAKQKHFVQANMQANADLHHQVFNELQGKIRK